MKDIDEIEGELLTSSHLWVIPFLPTPALYWWWGTPWVIFPVFVIGCALTLAFMVTAGWRKVETT